MGKSAHHCFPELRHKLAERWTIKKISAQRQRVHKVADYIREFHAGPACGWRAHHDLLLTGEAVQQNLKARQQRHEQRALLLGAQVLQLLGQPFAETKW